MGTFTENIKKTQLDQILNEKLRPLEEKIDNQTAILLKIASIVLGLRNDGEINNNTFNKLDEFLKPYFDNPYQDDKY